MFEGIWLNCFSLKLLSPGKKLLQRKVSALLLSCQKNADNEELEKGFEELSNTIMRLWNPQSILSSKRNLLQSFCISLSNKTISIIQMKP